MEADKCTNYSRNTPAKRWTIFSPPRATAASQVLRERMAESVATRRLRFLYLERHQKKTSTLNKPASALQENEAPEDEETVPAAIQLAQQQQQLFLSDRVI